MVRVFLAVAILALVSAVLFMVYSGSLEDTMRDVAMMVTGAIMMRFGQLYDFYFGSSDGSKQKSQVLDQEPVLSVTPEQGEV